MTVDASSQQSPPPGPNSRSTDISLTDFVYGIVVASVFPRLQVPVFTAENATLLFALCVIVDDWVLYHLQVASIPEGPRNFAVRLVGDVVVLFLWYLSAIVGSTPDNPVHHFLLFLAAFYLASGFWEFVFLKYTRTPVRLYIDAACLLLFLGAGALGLWIGEVPTIALTLLLVAWFLCRWFVWHRLLTRRAEPDTQFTSGP